MLLPVNTSKSKDLSTNTFLSKALPGEIIQALKDLGQDDSNMFMLAQKDRSVNLTSANLKVKINFYAMHQHLNLQIVFEKQKGLDKTFNQLLRAVQGGLSGLIKPVYN